MTTSPRSRPCPVCGEFSCDAATKLPVQPDPFTVQLLREANGAESLWFNVPESLNWNWLEPERGGSYCWEDLVHMVRVDGATLTEVPFDYEKFYWGCGGVLDFREGTPCNRVWSPVELAKLVPGYPACVEPCSICHDARWPTPRALETP